MLNATAHSLRLQDSDPYNTDRLHLVAFAIKKHRCKSWHNQEWVVVHDLLGMLVMWSGLDSLKIIG